MSAIRRGAPMYIALDGVDPATYANKEGLRFRTQCSTDNGHTFQPTSNTPEDLGQGRYVLELTATETAGETVMLRYEADGGISGVAVVPTLPGDLWDVMTGQRVRT